MTTSTTTARTIVTSLLPDRRAKAPRRTTPGLVVAAVRAGGTHLDEVVARAVARAEETDVQIVFFTVITRRPLGNELVRVRRELSRHTWPVHLVATWVDVEAVDPAEATHLIATEIVRATTELGADALVLGMDLEADLSAPSIASRVATRLPDRVELCLSVALSETGDRTEVRPPLGHNAGYGEFELTAGTVVGHRHPPRSRQRPVAH